MMSCQPSMTIKNINFMGSEIITGGSIIIPKLIKIEATIISITKNGRNIKNPISKEVRNSLTRNAGINSVKDTSSIFLGFSVFLIL